MRAVHYYMDLISIHFNIHIIVNKTSLCAKRCETDIFTTLAAQIRFECVTAIQKSFSNFFLECMSKPIFHGRRRRVRKDCRSIVVKSICTDHAIRYYQKLDHYYIALTYGMIICWTLECLTMTGGGGDGLATDAYRA